MKTRVYREGERMDSLHNLISELSMRHFLSFTDKTGIRRKIGGVSYDSSGSGTLLFNFSASSLTYFHGNCSSIVLSGVQGFNEDRLSCVVEFAKQTAFFLRYALVWASTTSDQTINMLKSLGFQEVLSGVHNYHSGNINTFLVLKVDCEKDYYEVDNGEEDTDVQS